MSLFGTPRGKLWASALVLAAAATTATAEVETRELEVPGRACSSGFWSLQHLVLGDAPLSGRVHAPTPPNLKY